MVRRRKQLTLNLSSMVLREVELLILQTPLSSEISQTGLETVAAFRSKMLTSRAWGLGWLRNKEDNEDTDLEELLILVSGRPLELSFEGVHGGYLWVRDICNNTWSNLRSRICEIFLVCYLLTEEKVMRSRSYATKILFACLETVYSLETIRIFMYLFVIFQCTV